MKTITKVTWIFIFVISLIYAVVPYQTQNLNGTSYADIDSYITSKLDELRIPGISLGIINGKEIYVKGYGESDSTGTPVTPDTPFILGSTTKSITAAAVMQLVEQGKIILDEKAVTYLPYFHFKNINESDKITVKQLLNQTSGIAGPTGGSDYLDGISTREDFIKELKNEDLYITPGESYQYAEANFIILGEIITAVSGQSYESYIQEHIFNPLDMNNSYTNKKKAQENGLSGGNITWFGYPIKTDLPYPKQYTSGSALISTADDLTHYIKFYIDNGKYNNKEILSSESISEIIKPSVPLLHPAGYSYGMGWFVQDKLIIHDGRPTNYYSVILIEPEKKTGIVLLANANNRLITAEYLMPTAFEIMNKLTGKPTANGGLGFRQLYKIINILFLLIALYLIYRIIKTHTVWSKKIRKSEIKRMYYFNNILADIIIIAVIICLLVYLLFSYGVSVKIAYLGQPDIVLSLFVFMLMPFVNIITKIILINRSKKQLP